MSSIPIVRWGILGPGNIANNLAKGVAHLEDAEVVAVGSRDAARANAFADKYNIPNRHGSYQALVEDPQVDVVYVATPHPFHCENSLLALRAGKPVMCEKPFTINEAELKRVVDEARSRKLFLMEAMWTRFFPVMYRLRDLVREGAIGEVRMIQADFGFRGGTDPKGRTLALELGGGALLDVGVYPISLASMLLGEPATVTGLATLGATGVDEQAAMVFQYTSGAIASLTTAVRTNTPHIAHILGSDGSISIPAPWWKPDRISVKGAAGDEEIHIPWESSGFHFQAAEVGRCLRADELESPVMPLDESLAIMRTMDKLRAQWGIKYPSEIAK